MLLKLEQKSFFIMRLFITLVFACSLVNCSLLQSPCGNDKDEFLYNFHKFVKEVKNEDLTYDDQSWEDFDLTFKKFTKECYPTYKEELTRADREEYFENTMGYYVTKYGEGLAKQFEDEGEVVIEQIRESIEDWFDNEGKDLERKIEEWVETDGKELGRKLEETFKKLEESIDEEKIEDALKRFGEFLEGIEINIESKENRDL